MFPKGFFCFGLDSSTDNLAFKILWLVEPSFSEAPKSLSRLQMMKEKQHLSLFCGQKLLSAALYSVRAGCIPPKSLVLVSAAGWLHVAWGLTASPAFSVVTKRRFPQPRVGLLLLLTRYKMQHNEVGGKGICLSLAPLLTSEKGPLQPGGTPSALFWRQTSWGSPMTETGGCVPAGFRCL